MTRQNEASSVSSPTKAATVVGVPPERKRSETGTTGAPASMAAWNMAGRNAPLERPHQVVPSGKTATTPPARSAAVTSATVVGSVRGRVRSMNTVRLTATERFSAASVKMA